VPYQLTVEERPGYLHAKVVGERTAANAFRFLQESFAACVESGHSSLLLELGLSGPSLGTTAVFTVISQEVAKFRKLHKIGYVQTEVPNPDIPYFAETVAFNRGVNVRLFKDIEAAQRWLAEDS
jgi:hypothetical protein